MPAPKLRVATTKRPTPVGLSRPTDAPLTAAQCIMLPAYESIALVLQGDGVLGSYQTGVFEGLNETGIVPNRIAGISIEALNTAIIAGDVPEHRQAKLREFWRIITQPTLSPPLPGILEDAWFDGNAHLREWLAAMQTADTLLEGQRGFFTPRFPAPLPANEVDPLEANYYDTTPFRAMLGRLCDFDHISDGGIRVSVGTVNIRTGNLEAFDNTERHLRAKYFMASGALPPGFPPVLTDGEYYWDGGVLSNTPLSYVLGSKSRRDTLVFQVDLQSALSLVLNTMIGVASRQEDLRYSSRTRPITDQMEHSQPTRRLMHKLFDRLPPKEFERMQWYKHAQEMACTKRYNVSHLIYTAKEHGEPGKDIQFGPSTMCDHWASGLAGIRESLSHPEWLRMPDNDTGFVAYDIRRCPSVERGDERL